MEYFDAISETSYLSVPNAPVYRKIMCCFYREYEKLQYQLYKEDILKQDEAFENYSMWRMRWWGISVESERGFIWQI